VVFFDEPMSGLDPLGRRDVRELILQLRDRGCTVFFSSHVLSDAESLCSRVAILVAGRLAASGELSELLAFQVRAWELVMTGLTEAALATAKAQGHVIRETRIGNQRYALELPLTVEPGRVLGELAAAGAQLVSLTPMRETLEDFFVRQIGTVPGDRGLESAAP
jgi:ABC-2 type transport system ATP-binding protein